MSQPRPPHARHRTLRRNSPYSHDVRSGKPRQATACRTVAHPPAATGRNAHRTFPYCHDDRRCMSRKSRDRPPHPHGRYRSSHRNSPGFPCARSGKPMSQALAASHRSCGAVRRKHRTSLYSLYSRKRSSTLPPVAETPHPPAPQTVRPALVPVDTHPHPLEPQAHPSHRRPRLPAPAHR